MLAFELYCIFSSTWKGQKS